MIGKISTLQDSEGEGKHPWPTAIPFRKLRRANPADMAF
ncbi:MAG: hypothetical protein ACI9TB_002592, partial [Parasphingorhabdus sp.]